MRKANPENPSTKFGKLLAVWIASKKNQDIFLQTLIKSAEVYKSQFYISYDLSALDKRIEAAKADPVSAIYQSLKTGGFSIGGYMMGETSFNTVLMDTLSQACLEDRESLIANKQVEAEGKNLGKRLINELKFLGTFRSTVDTKAKAAEIYDSMQEQRNRLCAGK